MRTRGPGSSRIQVLGTLALAVAGLLFLEACKHEPQLEPLVPPVIDDDGGNGGGDEPCDPTIVYFQQQVLPILISNCSVPGCHNLPTDENDDIQITSYETLMASGIVQDGDLWEVINDNDPDKRMPPPPQNPLTPQQIGLIGQWIQQGAQNTSCVEAGCDTLNVTYSGTIVPLVQQKCLGCHSGGAPQGGLNFGNWSALNTVAQDGRLNASITHDPFGVPMPPNSPKLPHCDIRKFQLWIAAGAPNN